MITKKEITEKEKQLCLKWLAKNHIRLYHYKDSNLYVVIDYNPDDPMDYNTDAVKWNNYTEYLLKKYHSKNGDLLKYYFVYDDVLEEYAKEHKESLMEGD